MSGEMIFSTLLSLASQNGIKVRFKPLKANYARIKGNRIALCNKLADNIDDCNYNLAHELAHYFLHYDKGDIISMDKGAKDAYEEQADRGAKMLLEALAVKD